VLGLFITIASLVFVRRNEQRLEEEAEHVFPGSLDAPPVSQGVQDQGEEAYLALSGEFYDPKVVVEICLHDASLES